MFLTNLSVFQFNIHAQGLLLQSLNFGADTAQVHL